MLRSMLLMLLGLPTGALAQRQSVHLLISAPNLTQFWIVRPASDSGRGPVFGTGSLELATDAQDISGSAALPSIEVGTLDTLNKVHVDVTQNGRVIASGDGAYFTVRRDASGIALDVRSQVPPSARERLKRD
jgi:hypothetical protein